MKPDMFYTVLSIIGFFGTCGLFVCAHFFREFNKNLIILNNGMTSLIKGEKYQNKSIDDHENRLRKLERPKSLEGVH